jgi:hypothetical protein
MKIRFALLFLLLCGNCCFAQQFALGLSYNYMYSNQLDKAVQTYNFSRPYLDEKQPLFIHGIGAEASFLFRSEKKIRSGILVNYSHHQTSAENQDFNVALRLQMMNLGYVLHYQMKEKFKQGYVDLAFCSTLGQLSKHVNDEAVLIDDKKMRAYGFGGSIKLGIGCIYYFGASHAIAPFFKLDYAPFLRFAQAEAVVNQTTELSSKKNSSVLGFQTGLKFHF